MRFGRILLSGALLTTLAGCATAAIRPNPLLSLPHIAVPATPEAAFNITLDILNENSIPVLDFDEQAYVVRTNWTEGWSEKKFGFLGSTWKRRFRLIIRHQLHKDQTVISIRTAVEEKAPGGRMSLRWKRVPSDGQVEEELFRLIQKRLTGSQSLAPAE